MSIEKKIQTEELDQKLCARLIHSGDPQGKVTLIYVPGLGTIEGFARRAESTFRQIRRSGIDVNVVAFRYQSHNGRVLDGFEHDYDDLRQVRALTEDFGILSERIGLFGVCYGAYLAARNAAEQDSPAFTIMLEPYFGRSSLRAPLRQCAGIVQKAVHALPTKISSKIPIGRRFGGRGFVNLVSLLDNTIPDAPLERIRAPLLAIMSRHHRVFNAEPSLVGTERRSHHIYFADSKRVSGELVTDMYSCIRDFLARQYAPAVLSPDLCEQDFTS